MLPLGCSDFPADDSSLRNGVAHALAPLGLAVDALAFDGAFPSFSTLRLALTGARFHRGLRIAGAVENGTPAFFARSLEISAAPAHFETLPFTLDLHATDAVFTFARDAQDSTVLALARCGDGTLDLAITRADIESTLLALARDAAAKQGAEMQSVRVELTADGPRTLRLRATATAKAMFFTATLTLGARIEISDALDLRLRDLTCTGDGMIANLAAGYVRPHFAKLESGALALARFAPGLRDVSFDCADGLRIRARFGEVVAP